MLTFFLWRRGREHDSGLQQREKFMAAGLFFLLSPGCK